MIEQQVTKAIDVLRRLNYLAPVKILLSEYYDIVFPTLVYEILVWRCLSKNNLHRLQMLQNKFLRRIED